MANQNYVTVAMLANLLGVSRITIYKRVKKGEIAATKVGKTYIIDDQAVKEILGGKVTASSKERIDRAVQKTLSEYRDLLKQLGDE
jgi:excisionase family DNA binding protein